MPASATSGLPPTEIPTRGPWSWAGVGCLRNYYKARRAQLIAQRRRERIMPGRGTSSRSDKSKNARDTSRPGSSRTE